MLKIKDNVDLKELEKFGFEYKDGIYYKSAPSTVVCLDSLYGSYTETRWDSIMIFERDRHINGGNSEQFRMDYHTLFDLIEAGLVEKGKEDNGK